MDLLKWVIGIFILFGVGWFLIGGTQTEQRPFLRPPMPLDSGEQYGPFSDGIRLDFRGERGESATVDEDEGTGEQISSPFDGKVAFRGGGRADRSDKDEEYVVIEASRNNTEPINISNWTLHSPVTGRRAKIGTGTRIYYSGRIPDTGAIFLNPGDRATVVTGESPVGTSFRLNICSGYLEQFQDFSPTIRKQCPAAIDENPPTGPGGLSDSCLDYVEDIRRCEIITKFPLSLDNQCRGFITDTINYNACLDKHRTDDGFFLPEWRIFLGRSSELWKEQRETILLVDESGKTVDSLSY